METINNSKTRFQWSSSNLRAGYAARTMCMNRFDMLFCADWNGATGNLNNIDLPERNQWNDCGGDFKSNINQICADQLGNIYVVGDLNASNQYTIRIYHLPTNAWSVLKDAGGNEISYPNPINFVCCDNDNNVYFTGNFEINNEACVMKYSLSTKTCSPLNGGNFGFAMVSMQIDAHGNIYGLWTDADNVTYVNCWNGSAWNSVSYGSSLNILSFACDNEYNVYIATDQTVYKAEYPSANLTDLQAKLPKASGTNLNCIVHNNGVLYVAGYGFTAGTDLLSAYVKVYLDSAWTDITPPDFTTCKSISIFNAISYTGKSKNILVAASNSKVYDGKSIHL